MRCLPRAIPPRLAGAGAGARADANDSFFDMNSRFVSIQDVAGGVHLRQGAARFCVLYVCMSGPICFVWSARRAWTAASPNHLLMFFLCHLYTHARLVSLRRVRFIVVTRERPRGLSPSSLKTLSPHHTFIIARPTQYTPCTAHLFF